MLGRKRIRWFAAFFGALVVFAGLPHFHQCALPAVLTPVSSAIGPVYSADAHWGQVS